MKALCYAKPREFSVQEVPLPPVRDGDVLIKGLLLRKIKLTVVAACGVCGTDLHIHDGEFIAKVGIHFDCATHFLH